MPLAVAAHPGLTIPVAVVIALPLVWYWRRLGREDVPSLRRVIRRCSIALMLAALLGLVSGLSLLDPHTHQQGWVIAWTAVAFLMMLIIAAALVDAINNLNLHQQEKRQAMTNAATELIVAIRKARNADASGASQQDDASAEGEAEDEDPDS